MPKPYPKEFRGDLVGDACNREWRRPRRASQAAASAYRMWWHGSSTAAFRPVATNGNSLPVKNRIALQRMSRFDTFLSWSMPLKPQLQ